MGILDALKGKCLRGFGLIDTGLDALENFRKRNLREWKFRRSRSDWTHGGAMLDCWRNSPRAGKEVIAATDRGRTSRLLPRQAVGA
jgi:hypothetical protein